MNLDAFEGPADCKHWNAMGLKALEAVLQITPGRKVAVQAGGNLGVFAARLSREFEAVYTFEPDPVLFPLLVRNAPQPNIVRFQAALGDERDMISTGLPEGDGRHIGETCVAGHGIIPAMCLDDLSLTALDLLYLDVEGFELMALKGAEDHIRWHKPVIVCEINTCCERYGYNAADLSEWLMKRGYDIPIRVQSDYIFRPRAK